jgi:SAM-dependent methyltransferase
MKYRESNMPSSDQWDTFFDPNYILDQLGVNKSVNTFIDIGCGYGTFLFPAAHLVKNMAIGIDPEMIKHCNDHSKTHNITNVEVLLGDIDTINPDIYKSHGIIDYVALFNILLCEEPIKLLKYAHDLLVYNGKVGVIHWKHENTPRGPSMQIRPKPEQIVNWGHEAGLKNSIYVDLPPYHFGIVFTKI